MPNKIFFFLGAIFTCLAFPARSQPISGTFAIRNVKTGIYLRIKDANSENGTAIVAYSPVNWKCVTWDFKQLQDKSYRLTNLFSGKTLQPPSLPVQGVSLQEEPIDSSNSLQRYEFVPAEKGYYLIRLKGTELFLTPADDRGTLNAPIRLTRKIDGNLQFWQLKEQHPEI